LLNRKEKEHLELREKASQALESLTKHPHAYDSSNEESIMFISNEENVHFAIDATKKARRTLDFTTRYNLFLHTMNKLQLGLYIRELYKAAQRGVKFRMIIDKPINTVPVSKLSFQVSYSKALVSSPNFEYRYVESPLDCILILYDNERCLIETSKEQDVEVSPFLATNNQVLVKLCRSYFEKTWNSAINIDKIYAFPKTQ